MGRRRIASLPLGLDIGAEAVSIVACDAADEGFAFREAATLEVPTADDTVLDRTIAQTVRTALATIVTGERRCVLAAPAADVVTRVFRRPPNMRRTEAERAAALEADSIVDWPFSERLVALDPIPDKVEEMLLSIARNSTVERIVSIARVAGLRPIAVDVPACAWRRAVTDADAVLDCSKDRAALVVFADPVGSTHLFPPRLIDERLAIGVRAALVDARRDGRADVQRLTILGSRYRFESLEELLRDDGYAISPLTLGGTECPPWAFAYGLASWSVAPRGLVAK